MNQKIYLSEDWLFNENFQEGMTATEYPEETLQPVRIPHTCKETPFHYFDESLYQMVSGYRRHLHIPTEWQGKRILLTCGKLRLSQDPLSVLEQARNGKEIHL